MKATFLATATIVAILQLGAGALTAGEPMGTAITYQGQIKDSGVPLDGTADLEFMLWDAESTGIPVGAPVRVENVQVINGLFTVGLDFGIEAFGGEARWMEIAVRIPHDPTDMEPFVPLDGRQELTAAPFATYARVADEVQAPLSLFSPDPVPVFEAISPEAVVRIASDNCGLYAEYSGEEGDLRAAAYGMKGTHTASGNWGFLGDNQAGAGGFNPSNSTSGFLGDSQYGAYGRRGSGASANHGYLGNSQYGAYGRHGSSGNHGVLGRETAGVFEYSNSNRGVWGQSPSGWAGYFTGDVHMTNRLVIGTTTLVTNSKLAVKGGDVWIVDDNDGVRFYGGARIYKKYGSGLKIVAHDDDLFGVEFLTAAGESNMIVRDEKVGIGVNPTAKLDVNGTARLRGIGTGSGATVVAASNGTLYKNTSSRRYKTDIVDLDAVPDAILNLRPVKFNWKSTGQEDIGLIAEEVEDAFSDLVILDDDGEPYAVKYDKVALYLLSVVKAQQDRIVCLEEAVAELRGPQQDGGAR